MARIELVDIDVDGRLRLPPRLEIAAGETCAVWGLPGSGRSLLLDLIAGIARPARGRVLFDGRRVDRLPMRRRNIARVTRWPVVYERMTVADNLLLPMRARRTPRRERADWVVSLADRLGLADQLGARATSLPLPLRQRVAVGRAFAREDVAAVLLDDPLAELDPVDRRALRRVIAGLQGSSGATVVWATRDASDVAAVAQRVLSLEAGELVEDADPGAWLEAPRRASIARAQVDPPMNLLPCVARGRWVVVAGERIELPRPVTPPPETSRVELGVRAEDLQLCREAAANAVRVVVQRIEHRGHRQVVTVRIGDETAWVACPEDQRVGDDGGYFLRLPAERLRVYVDGLLAEEHGGAG